MVPEMAGQAEISTIISGTYIGADTQVIQGLSVSTYRLLAGGRPVSPRQIADTLNVDQADVENWFSSLPASTFERDREGLVTAFIGLSLSPTRHRFSVGGKQLFTWCVFDALFLPEIIGLEARLQTKCPHSGQDLTARIGTGGSVEADPESCVMSWLVPDLDQCRDDLRGAFCNHISLYASRPEFDAAGVGDTGATVLSLNQAVDLARQRNRLRYPDMQF